MKNKWNLVRREHLARLEAEHNALLDLDRQANEREELRQAFEGNTNLQLWAVVHGKPGVHFIFLETVVVMENTAKGKVERLALLN